ncbi:hypothetical protein ScPMuIL_000068 [Solemya velum]
MSNRALRRLQGTSEIILQGKSDDSDQSADEEVKPVSKSKKAKKRNKPNNAFELLNAEENEDPEELAEAAITESTVSNEEMKDIDQADNSPAQSKKKKKKKKKKKTTQEESSADKVADDDIEATLREVEEILFKGKGAPNLIVDTSVPTFDTRGLLNVEHKNLNPDNELRRIFGSRVIQSSQSNDRRQRNRGRQRSSWLAQPKHSWPTYAKTGLTMTVARSDNGQNGEQHFNFEHSHQYQQVQFQFLDAVETLNPQNIANVAQTHPYHIDTIIQLSEVFRMSEDMQIATEFMEKALYSFEMSFHPLFSLTTGTCRLDFRHPENSELSHIRFCSTRACSTLQHSMDLVIIWMSHIPICVDTLPAMEAYNFTPCRHIVDIPVPFCVLIHILRRLYRNILCLMFLAIESRLAALPYTVLFFDMSTTWIQSVCRFQSFESVFIPCVQPNGLKQLIGLYIGRCFSCWKQPEVITWLETNVREVLKKVDHNPMSAEELCTKYSSHYKGTPRNVLRHILLSEIKEATTALPPDLAKTPILS